MKTTLPDGHGLSEQILNDSALMPAGDSGPSLTDVQYQALERGVGRGESVLISSPTSTGKTLIGIWGISATLMGGGKCVYLVSHRALAKQKFEEFQRVFLDTHLGSDRAAIVCATGDGIIDAGDRKSNNPFDARIIVATYEKFLGCLAVGGPPKDLTDVCFVCDEVQLVGDKTRGKSVELLLTLLKSAGWHQMVALSAVLSERDATSLADWLGLVLVRNPRREKALRIQLRTPSETQEVVADAERVSSKRENRQLARSTRYIVRELLSQAHKAPVIVFCCARVDDTYNGAAEWLNSGFATKTAPEVPPTVEMDERLKRALERRVAYHNSELSEEERLYIEDRLLNGHIDVVFATTTLAAGVNFPLGSAVFDTWVRWNPDRGRREPISRPEFQNMAGRVGRMGQNAEEGLVVLFAQTTGEAQQAVNLINLDGQDDLGTGIQPEDFGALVLQLFAGRLCQTRDEAYDLLAGTLSAARERERNRAGISHWREKLEEQVDRLVELECIVEMGSRVTTTSFGLAVARSGLKPETAVFFLENISARADALAELIGSGDDPSQEDDFAFVVIHAALASPEFTFEGGKPSRYLSYRFDQNGVLNNEYARRLISALFIRPWTAMPAAANGALVLTRWVSGAPRDVVESTVNGVRLGTIQTTAREVGWILTGISDIVTALTARELDATALPASLKGAEDLERVRALARPLKRQAMRVASGLLSDTLWMAGLDLAGPSPRLSRSQILALRSQGLVRPTDLMRGDDEADTKRINALGGVESLFRSLANQIRDAARAWKHKQRTHCMNYQIKRLSPVGGADALRAIYTVRGTGLEVALENVIRATGFRFDKLDTGRTQGRPDYELQVEGFDPIIVEVKSRESDSELIGLNGATEVLTASELLGCRDAFCVTICSPGVDPSVPTQIEACGRLCVVDVCDLAEAFVRLSEGTLTPAQFNDWLTRPGVALMEDLPSEP